MRGPCPLKLAKQLTMTPHSFTATEVQNISRCWCRIGCGVEKTDRNFLTPQLVSGLIANSHNVSELPGCRIIELIYHRCCVRCVTSKVEGAQSCILQEDTPNTDGQTPHSWVKRCVTNSSIFVANVQAHAER